jgi:SAM-dependent methyltransferase
VSRENKRKDWYDISHHCGTPVDVLDIGCGSGHIHEYLVPSLRVNTVHLMDGDAKIRGQMGWNREWTTPWNNVDYASSRVASLGGVEVQTHKANPELTIPVDLIISLKSWGFHYPVAVYLPLAKRSLRPGGRIVLDIRKNQNQIEIMSKWFHLVELDVGRSAKCFRSVWRHRER